MSAPELLKMARDMYQVGDKQCIEVAKVLRKKVCTVIIH